MKLLRYSLLLISAILLLSNLPLLQAWSFHWSTISIKSDDYPIANILDYTYKASPVLEIDQSCGTVEIKHDESIDYIKVTATIFACAGHEKDVSPLLVEENNILKIKTKQECNQAKAYISYTITVPANMKSIKVISSSGNVAVKGIFIDNLIIENGSGNISVTTCIIPEGTLKTSSGTLMLDKSGGIKLTLETISGDINIRKSSAQNLNITTRSGNINANTLRGKAAINTESGTITLKKSQISGTIKALSGNIQLETKYILSDFDIQTTTGTIDITIPVNIYFPIYTQTQSGTIRSDIVTVPLKIKSENEKWFIALKTKSGNITIISKGMGNYE